MTRIRHPGSRRSWLPAPVLGCVLLLGVLLLGLGFLRFMGQVPQPGSLPPRADGIVVLTGGADRIATALRLLAQGRGRILLVSGVGGDAGFVALARQSGADPALASRVTLGRMAASTYGNAQETAAWAHANRVASLIVVTAYYHMPRAMAELARALPGVRLYPDAVQPPDLRGPAAWRLLAGEYAKWLAAKAGLSSLASRVTPAERIEQTETRDRATRMGG